MRKSIYQTFIQITKQFDEEETLKGLNKKISSDV